VNGLGSMLQGYSLHGQTRKGVEPVEIEWTNEEHHYQNYSQSRSGGLGDHVNVRRPFRAPAQDDRMSRSFSHETQTSGSVMTASMSGGRRTIDESLALIQHHVQDLGQAEIYEGVPPPPSSTEATPPPMIVAPPPGFDDSDTNGGNGGDAGNFRRFGASRISRAPSSDRPNGLVSSGQKIHSDFRGRSLLEWSEIDVSNWLDSLFMPEYKGAFLDSGVTGARLTTLDNRDWERLGVTKITHRLNILKSIKRYMPKK